MVEGLRFEIARNDQLAAGHLAEILALCERAYQEDLQELFETFHGSMHVLAYLDASLVSHAMWVTRWLQVGQGALLRTAYVEMVASEPAYQRHGFASAVMERLAHAIRDFDLGALCPADTSLYRRLGWVYWRGPLLIRTPRGVIATPEEQVMILSLPRTPPLDLYQPLTAEWREGELW